MLELAADGKSPSFEYCANKQQATEATSENCWIFLGLKTNYQTNKQTKKVAPGYRVGLVGIPQQHIRILLPKHWIIHTHLPSPPHTHVLAKFLVIHVCLSKFKIVLKTIKVEPSVFTSSAQIKHSGGHHSMCVCVRRDIPLQTIPAAASTVLYIYLLFTIHHHQNHPHHRHHRHQLHPHTYSS